MNGTRGHAEAARLAALDRYRVLDTAPDPIFENITALAAHVLGASIACVALVDAERIWMKSAYGIKRMDVPREPGLCMTALDHEGVHHLRDASLDPVAAQNSIVEGGVRFYAGCAIRTPDGHSLGTICVMDPEPRDLSASGKLTLELLARLTLSEIERHCVIHELAGARESLREGEQNYRALAELSPVGIFHTDASGNTEYVNARWSTISGQSFAEADARGWLTSVHPDDAQRVDENWRRCVEEGRASREEFRFLHADGSVVYVLGQAIPEKGERGDVTGYVGTITDVTGNRELEQRVQEAQKLESLGVLAGCIAHDFNNIIATIMGNANLALYHLTLSPECRAFVANIDVASQRAADLCDQLLAYAGKGGFSIIALDLNDQVRGMGDLLDVSISKKVTLVYDLGEDLPIVEGDVTQMRQVLLNLITNAAEALRGRSGEVRIVTSALTIEPGAERGGDSGYDLEPGEFVALEVIDTGCGLEPGTQRRMFEPFFTTKRGGRGLGLAAVQGIVRAHGGAIEIESEPEAGTTFRVILPVSKLALEEPVAEEPIEVRWRGHGTILIVEDDDLVLDYAEKVLERIGFRVLTARDGFEALEVFGRAADGVSLVLLDMTMPNLDGAETLRELSRVWPSVRVLFTSGYHESETARRLAQGRAVGFLKKPYRPSQLVHAVREILGSAQE